MNLFLKRFGPPATVLSAALYLGWPPAGPLDLGETIVKAKSVRWKARDLTPPEKASSYVDPFRDVLIANAETGVESDPSKQVAAAKPTGPSRGAIRAAMTLSGIAKLGDQSWAIVNGKPHLLGELVQSNDNSPIVCMIESIGRDHVVVACENTRVTLRPPALGSAKHRTPDATLPSARPNSADSPGAKSPTEVPPPIIQAAKPQA